MTSRRPTELARRMVCEFGMSTLGPITYGKKEEQIFLGREIAQHQDYSEDTAIKIDQEVNRLIIEQYNRARQIIVENKDALVRLAEALLERESLDSIQIPPAGGWACRLTTTSLLNRETEKPKAEGKPSVPEADYPASSW